MSLSYQKNNKLLLVFVIVLSIISISKTSKLIELEQNFVELLNSIRETPIALSKFMRQKYLPKFNKKIYDNKVKTKEGAFAAEDLIIFLKNMESKRELQFDQTQSSIASKHSHYMASLGKLTHYDEELNTPIQRLFKVATNVKGKTTQVVARLDKKLKDLLSVLIFLLIDDGISNRFNRKVLLSDEWTKIGLGLKFESSFFYITIQQAENIECDTSCKSKTMKIFEELPNQNLDAIDLKALQLELFKKYTDNLNKSMKIKALEATKICPNKITANKDNCLQKDDKDCNLCANAVRLQDSKCESERNYIKDDNFCDEGCSHCNWIKTPNTGFFKKNCLICKGNFLRRSDFSDLSCHEKTTVFQSEFLHEIPNCEHHDYRDLDAKNYDKSQIKCYLCKYGYTLIEGKNDECVKQPSNLRKSFSNCRILNKLLMNQNSEVNWQDSQCTNCIEDPLLVRSIKKIELTEQKIKKEVCNENCDNLCSDKCEKEDLKCSQRCLRFCQRQCDETNNDELQEFENVSVETEDAEPSAILIM